MFASWLNTERIKAETDRNFLTITNIRSREPKGMDGAKRAPFPKGGYGPPWKNLKNMKIIALL